jgi:hypothetical protein
MIHYCHMPGQNWLAYIHNFAAVPTNNLLSTEQRTWLVSVSLPPPADRQDENEDMEINNSGLSLFDISP